MLGTNVAASLASHRCLHLKGLNVDMYKAYWDPRCGIHFSLEMVPSPQKARGPLGDLGGWKMRFSSSVSWRGTSCAVQGLALPSPPLRALCEADLPSVCVQKTPV